MNSLDYFYPGFEHAGFETALDRALTLSLCAAVLAFQCVSDAGRSVISRLAPAGVPAYEG